MADFRIERTNTRCQLVLEGDLTVSKVADVQAALKQELEQKTDELVMDLGKTAMLDSSGIGLLIAAANTVTRKQGKFSVINVSSDIMALLQSMRLAARLNVTCRPTA